MSGKIPSTSFQTWTSSTSRAAPRTVAVRSLPPLPSVVIAPAERKRVPRWHVNRDACLMSCFFKAIVSSRGLRMALVSPPHWEHDHPCIAQVLCLNQHYHNI